MELRGRTLAITGIGGFVGLRAAERARALGMRVRGLDRGDDALRRAARIGFDAMRGDVREPADVRRLCEGADVVLHTAAVVEEDGDRALFQSVNVDGTRCVAQTARDAGAQRFVQLSSVMVYGFAYPPDIDEDGPLCGEGNPYCETKIESERVALSFDAAAGMRVVALRAGDVYGPGSIPWVVRPIGLMRRGLFMLPDGGRGVMNHVYVDDLVDAAFAAASRDVGGCALNVTDGAPSTFASYFTQLGAPLGVKHIRTLPAGVLRASFAALERVARLAGQRAPASPAAVDFVARPHAVSSARVREVLGWAPRVAIAEGLRRTHAWLRSERLL
jgi:nucleoside-diphosphate-sugar epimerase